MSESLLKKEFKKRDVQRIRNLVKKDFSGGTRVGSGYSKGKKFYKEGDVWEEKGKTWTIKNGIRQNITKLDAAKKAVKIPLTCPKCGGSMKHHLAKKMYKIHGFCFDPCVVEYEAALRKEGLFEAYEKKMLQGGARAFVKDLEEWMLNEISSKDTYVTEHGVVEDWKSNSDSDNKFKSKIYEFVDYIKEQLK